MATISANKVFAISFLFDFSAKYLPRSYKQNKKLINPLIQIIRILTLNLSDLMAV